MRPPIFTDRSPPPHLQSTPSPYIFTLGSLLALFSAWVKMAEGLFAEKNSLPTDQNKNPVSAKPPRMTTK